MDNLVYWDTNAQRIRTAKHNTHDEVQYSDDPTAQSPASKHLLEVITGAPYDKRGTEIMLETAKPDLNLMQETLQPINQQLIHDLPLPQATAAAKFARPSPSGLTQELEMLDVTLNSTFLNGQ
jgi:hypothetical protein